MWNDDDQSKGIFKPFYQMSTLVNTILTDDNTTLGGLVLTIRPF